MLSRLLLQWLVLWMWQYLGRPELGCLPGPCLQPRTHNGHQTGLVHGTGFVHVIMETRGGPASGRRSYSTGVQDPSALK